MVGTPVIEISDTVVDEKAGRVVFTLTLDRPSATTVGVNVATLDGTALAGTDYQALGAQPVAFAPGEMAKTVVVNLIDDATTEPGEYFSLVLSSPVGATLPDTQAKATIAASDAANVATPTISVADVVVSEGQGYAEFVVSLSAPSPLAVSVSYQTVQASALAIGYTNTPDFALIGNQTLSFAPGETLKTVRIALFDDALPENAESFHLNLYSPANGLLGTSLATATIIDNDGLPSLSIGSVLVSEKATVANFVVSLGKASTTPVSVTVVTVNGTAIVGQDYQALAPLTLVFAPGERTKTVSISILPNTSNEPDETFFVDAISQPANAILANTRGTATILGAGTGTTPSLKTTADLSNGDLLLALAQFSKAAYALREDEPRTNLSLANPYFNDVSPEADTALAKLKAAGWAFMEPGAFGPGLALSNADMKEDGQFHKGLLGGIYTNLNAAVLLARSADALVIAIRGTDDARFSKVSSIPALISGVKEVSGSTPDQNDWVTPGTHYAKLSELRTAITTYLELTANADIKHVYVTGHSLGASIGQIFMVNQKEIGENATWQAALFAAPGTKNFISGGGLTGNFWVSGDAIETAAFFNKNLGDDNYFEPTIAWKDGNLSQKQPFDLSSRGDDTSSDVGGELHSMSLYLHVVERLHSATGDNFDAFLMLGGIGTNYYQVLLNVDATLTRDFGDVIPLNDEWHWYKFSEPTKSTVSATGRIKGPFVLVGGTGSDHLTGSLLSDLLLPGSGSDFLDGGFGTDTVAYSGPRSSYTITKTSAGFTVTDGNGTDTLQSVERLKFSDGGIALDVGATQSAGAAQLLLGAVLGKDLLATKKPLIGTAIDLFDQGYNLQQLSGAVMRLDIWGLLANSGQPAATNTQIANYLLTTVLKAAPDAATLNASVMALDTETGAAQGNFLWHLAESAANQIQVGLVGLATTGLEFG